MKLAVGMLAAFCCCIGHAQTNTNRVAGAFGWKLGSAMPRMNNTIADETGIFCMFSNTNFPPFQDFAVRATTAGKIYYISGSSKELTPTDTKIWVDQIRKSLASKYPIKNKIENAEFKMYSFGDDEAQVSLDIQPPSGILTINYSDEALMRKTAEVLEAKKKEAARKAASGL